MYILTDARYSEIIDDVMVDSYDEYEQVGSFGVMLQENVQFPLTAYIIGQEVSVTDFTSDSSRIIALVTTKTGEYWVDLRDIDVDESPETEWIVAYKRWREEW